MDSFHLMVEFSGDRIRLSETKDSVSFRFMPEMDVDHSTLILLFPWLTKKIQKLQQR